MWPQIGSKLAAKTVKVVKNNRTTEVCLASFSTHRSATFLLACTESLHFSLYFLFVPALCWSAGSSGCNPGSKAFRKSLCVLFEIPFFSSEGFGIFRTFGVDIIFLPTLEQMADKTTDLPELKRKYFLQGTKSNARLKKGGVMTMPHLLFLRNFNVRWKMEKD